MDTSTKVKEWAKAMGYKGLLPDDLSHIVNASSAHIWEQVITRGKPKGETSRIRNTILLRKLEARKSKNPGYLSDTVLECPNKELETYEKWQSLMREVNEKKIKVKEAQRQVKKLRNKNNAIKTDIEQNLTRDIEETQQKEVLYREKQKQLKEVKKSKEAELQKQTKLNEVLNPGNKQKATCEDIDKVVKDFEFLLEADCYRPIRHSVVHPLYCQYNEIVDVIETKEDQILPDLLRVEEEANSLNKDFIDHCSELYQENLKKLQGEHIKEVFKSNSLEKKAAELEEKINEKREEIYEKLKKRLGNNIYLNFKSKLEENLNTIEKETLQLVYKEELIKLNKPVANCNEDNPIRKFHKTKFQINRAWKNLHRNIQMTSSFWDRIMKTKTRIEECVEEANVLLRNISMRDYIKVKSLCSKIYSDEIQTFELFNLEYNKRLCYSKIPSLDLIYRDGYDSKLCFVNLDENFLYKLVDILSIPITSSQEIFKFFEDKRRRYYQLLNNVAVSTELELGQYTTCDLEKNKKKKQMEVKKFPKTMDHRDFLMFKKSLDLWYEMPFAKYVSEDIKFKNQSYKFYEAEFMRLYSQLDDK